MNTSVSRITGNIVGKNNNILEINGTRYDAKTGAPLSHAPKAHIKSPSQHQPIKSAVKRPTMSDVVRQPAKPAASRNQKPSSTLMRHAVKKPAAAPRKHSKAQGHVEIAKRPASQLIPKKSISQLDGKRLVKAKRIAQSKLIQHFSPVTSDSNRFATIISAPVASASPVLPAKPAPTHNKARSKPQTTAELLDHALRHATSHDQKAPAKAKKHRGFKIATTAVVLFLLAGVAISQQIPNLRMHLASSKAGFHASMPDYKPAGYSLGKLDAGDGVVATTFNSNSDQRRYTLTQKTSNWDSQALLDNFVVTHDKKYKVASSAGRTVYIYGDQNATWVNAGIWYIVQTDGSLTSSQLAELASSL